VKQEDPMGQKQPIRYRDMIIPAYLCILLAASGPSDLPVSHGGMLRLRSVLSMVNTKSLDRHRL
jgi:hypothetical protein